jgi:hypothetical protein
MLWWFSRDYPKLELSIGGVTCAVHTLCMNVVRTNAKLRRAEGKNSNPDWDRIWNFNWWLTQGVAISRDKVAGRQPPRKMSRFETHTAKTLPHQATDRSGRPSQHNGAAGPSSVSLNGNGHSINVPQRQKGRNPRRRSHESGNLRFLKTNPEKPSQSTENRKTGSLLHRPIISYCRTHKDG